MSKTTVYYVISDTIYGEYTQEEMDAICAICICDGGNCTQGVNCSREIICDDDTYHLIEVMGDVSGTKLVELTPYTESGIKEWIASNESDPPGL